MALYNDPNEGGNRPSFIDALADDLQPIRPAQSVKHALVAWSIFSWTITGSLLFMTAPLDLGIAGTLSISPRKVMEFILVALTALVSAVAGFEWGVPGDTLARRLLLPLTLIGLLSISSIASGLFEPATESLVLSLRPYCNIQIVAFAFPGLALGLVVMANRSIFRPVAAGALMGVAAGMISASSMQLACHSDPFHAIVYHFMPIALVAIVGGVSARCFIAPR